MKSTFTLLALLLTSPPVRAQLPGVPSSAAANAAQTARILGLDGMVQQLRDLRSQRPAGSAATVEELSIRMELLESIQAAALDVDSVLSEIRNERDELGDLRTSLQNRRDRTVGMLNTAAILTGSGLGIAVSATQFSNFGKTAQNAGDGIGVGAGAVSTVLSLLALRQRGGPKESVGATPNMLAPLFETSTPQLGTYYPQSVLQFLQSIPASQDANRGTRLGQLKALWVKEGRIDESGSSKARRKLAALTTSMNPQITVSIHDLSDRIAMLTDLSGRVSLMRRDLAVLMRTYRGKD